MTPGLGFGRRYVAVLAIFAISVLSPALTFASDLVFGPVTCQRGTGAPTVFNYSFAASEPSRGFVFKVYNGGLEDTIYEQVSSSIITLNGVQILGPSNFNQNIVYLEVPVTLQAQNTLSVEVRGKTGGAIIVKIFPIVVIKAPAQGQIFGAQPVTVSGSLYSATTSVTVNGLSATVDAGTFSVTGVPLLSGSNVLTATATGAGGFSGSDSVQVTLDSVPPVVSIEQPLEGFVTRQEVVPLYTVNDASDPNPTVSASPLPPYVAEGAYHLTVTATDWAGNTATASRGFVIDKTAPTITFDFPSEGLLANQQLVPAYTIVDSLDSHPTVSLEPPPPYATEGNYQVNLTGTDWAGNQAQTTRNFTIDMTTPVISGLTPTPDSSTADAQVVVSANFSDALSGIQAESVRLEIDAADVTAMTTISESGLSYRPSTTLADGSHHLVLTVRDRAGNEATASWSFSVDTTPPAITIVTPADGETVATSTVVLVGSVDDAAAAITVNGTSVAVIGGHFTLSGIALSPGLNEITVTAVDALGNDSLTVLHVTYLPPVPVANLTATPSQVQVGGSAVLQWTTNNATSVSITPNVGSVAANGEVSITPATTTMYTLSASGPGGTATAQVTIVVVPAPGNVSISASPTTIHLGETVTLTWTAHDATGVLINQGIGLVQSSGSKVVQPTSTTEYVITTASPEGASQASVLVTVLGNVQPQPEGSFGEKYQDLIPPNATVAAYDSKRFSVVIGAVLDRTNRPIAGVHISILSHPEYGTVLTDDSGKFAIPVEGGGFLAVSFRKSGYLLGNRQVDVPWNGIAITETLTMIPEDVALTRVLFSGDATALTVHRSTPVADEYGSRSVTLVFAGDNVAYAKVDEKEIQLKTIDVRVTEFDTPSSMPAKLPPTSGFTYCVDMVVDGADQVRFAKPVVAFIDNFLDFPVGMAVPVGYFDRIRGVWVPSDNGMTVRLLDVDNDGHVDSLDANGDGAPDDINGNGQYNDEVSGISGLQEFVAGASYWRISVTHFTPWDCNYPFGPVAGAIAPNPAGNPSADQQKSEEQKDQISCTNSYVEHSSRVLHEDVSIPGTGMKLHYASNRVPGYKTMINVPVSGDTIPDVLKRIIVQLKVAGVQYEQIVAPGPNLNVQFTWDGRDFRGQPMSGTVAGTTRVGYVYDSVYYSPSNVSKAFAAAGTNITAIMGREELVSWKADSVTIQLPVTQGKIANGWMLSGYDQVDMSDPSILYRGDGSYSKLKAQQLKTVVDNWIKTIDMAFDKAGNQYIASGLGLVYKVDRTGTISLFAGGRRGLCGDNGPATSACLSNMVPAVATDSSGNVFISDFYNHRVRRIDKNGIITTVAGSSWNGVGGYSGDGGPAVDAKLYEPFGIAIDRHGNLYIADRGNNRVRMVDVNGIITTIAGTGQAGYNADNIPARNAQLNTPQDVVVDADGNVYISDLSNYRIRRINASGIISTIAGTGNYVYNGNGLIATQANIAPSRIELDPSGNIYFNDTMSPRIRIVDTMGTVSTVVGTGTYGYSLDGVQALAAQIIPYSVTLDNTGNVVIADQYYVRKIIGNSVKSMEFLDASGQLYRFDGRGRPLTVSDALSGAAMRAYTYDMGGNLKDVSDLRGNVLRLQRDGIGRPEGIEENGIRRVDLSLDESGNLRAVTFPDSSQFVFSYTADGLMTQKRDPNGNVFHHYFDLNGRLEGADDPEGGLWQFSNSVNNQGQILSTIRSAEGDLISHRQSIDSLGTSVTLSTDSSGGTSTATVPRNEMSRKEELACGTTVELQYELDPKFPSRYESKRTMRLDSGLTQTRQVARTYLDNNADGSPDMITYKHTVNGKTWTVANDVRMGSVTTLSPLGRQVTTSYDTARLLRVQYSVPGLIPVNYGYDDFGRLVSLGIGSRLSTTAYDGNGNPDYLISTDNQTFDYTYDIMDRLRSDARPDGSKVDYQYDANGNLQAIDIYGDGSFSFGYTANNQRNNYVQPISGAYKYSYDRDRRLKGIITPSGEMITNSYVNGNLATSTTPEGVTRYSYLCASRPEKIGRNGESISFGYDGPLVTSDTRSGSVSGAITYLYNSDFLVTTMTYAGSTVALGYDSDGLLTSAGGFSIARNIQNGLAEGVSGVGLTQARIYNGYAELDGLTSSVSGAHPYAWSVLMRDNNGRIRQRQETINGSTTTWEYAYNPIGRLTDVKKDGVAVESYAYDLNGNRLTEINTSRGIIGRSFGYSDEDHVLTAGSEDYQFDVDGFLQSKTTAGATTSYSYSSLGELQTVWLSNGDILSYLHDPMGRRIAKKVNGAIVEKYLWKDLTTLLAVYDGADNLLQRFNYADGRVPVSMTAGGATYFLLTDQVGTLRAVVDSTGTIVKRIDYDSFGNIISDSNPGFSVPFGFAGGLHDRDTGLVRFGARDYDPAIGRFVAKDPIDFAGGDTNLYAYVMSDPVNMIDPGGLWGFGLIGSGSAEVGLGQGAGATGSLGGGLFGGGPEGLNPGGFASFGAMRGGLGEGKGYPCSDPDNFIGGGFVGAGGGAFFTNATSASGLKGPFYTASFNIAFPWLPVKFSAQLGWSGGTWIGSVTFGPGFGMSASGYKTNTWTTP